MAPQKDHLSCCNETPSTIAADMQTSHNILTRLQVKRMQRQLAQLPWALDVLVHIYLVISIDYTVSQGLE